MLFATEQIDSSAFESLSKYLRASPLLDEEFQTTPEWFGHLLFQRWIRVMILLVAVAHEVSLRAMALVHPQDFPCVLHDLSQDSILEGDYVERRRGKLGEITPECVNVHGLRENGITSTVANSLLCELIFHRLLERCRELLGCAIRKCSVHHAVVQELIIMRMRPFYRLAQEDHEDQVVIDAIIRMADSERSHLAAKIARCAIHCHHMLGLLAQRVMADPIFLVGLEETG